MQMSVKDNNSVEKNSEYEKLPDEIADALNDSEWELRHIDVGKDDEHRGMEWERHYSSYELEYEGGDKKRSIIANKEHFTGGSTIYAISYRVDGEQESIRCYDDTTSWLINIVGHIRKTTDENNINYSKLPEEIADALEDSDWELWHIGVGENEDYSKTDGERFYELYKLKYESNNKEMSMIAGVHSLDEGETRRYSIAFTSKKEEDLGDANPRTFWHHSLEKQEWFDNFSDRKSWLNAVIKNIE